MRVYIYIYIYIYIFLYVCVCVCVYTIHHPELNITGMHFLICCHFWALLPVFVFPVITSALILDSVILLWLPWLWLFPWTLILAACPDYSAWLSDYVSALSTLFPLLVIDPVLFDHSNKQSCKWIPLRLMFYNTFLVNIGYFTLFSFSLIYVFYMNEPLKVTNCLQKSFHFIW